MKNIILVILLTTGFEVLAQAPDCTQVVTRLETYTRRVSDNNYAVASFVREVSIAMDDWYIDYSAFEGQTVVVAEDYFLPLRDAADGIGETVNVAYEQMDTLDTEGREVLDLVETCLKATTAP